jgi:hypothetical protein
MGHYYDGLKKVERGGRNSRRGMQVKMYILPVGEEGEMAA